MSRSYSLAHVTVLGCPPPEAIGIAARCGYDFVGLRNMPLGLDLHAQRRGQIAKLPELILDEGAVPAPDVADHLPGAQLRPARQGARAGLNIAIGRDDHVLDIVQLHAGVAQSVPRGAK